MPSQEVQSLYDQIKAATERLNEIRQSCIHPVFYEGYYSWRPGCIDPKKLCSVCGEVLGDAEHLGPFMTQNASWQFAEVNDNDLC